MWTILPAVILVSLFIISVRTMAEVGTAGRCHADPGDRRQFPWEFSYPRRERDVDQ